MGQRCRVGVVTVSLSLLAAASLWAAEVQVYTDREIRQALLEWINQAERSIDVEMYTLTSRDVIAALKRAEAHGVEVRVILDPNQQGNHQQVESLKEHGVEVKWFPVRKPALMHRKLAIVDGKRIFAGSVNWTANGLTKNEELMLLIDDPALATRLQERFDADWSQSWMGEPPPR